MACRSVFGTPDMVNNKSNTMKILIFTPQIYLLGGAERLAVELAEGINRCPGMRADILSMTSAELPGSKEAINRLFVNGIPSVRFLDRTPGTGSRNLISDIWKLRQILVKENYDIIETTLPAANTLASWAVIGLHTKHIAGIHDIYQLSKHNNPAYKFWRFSVRLSRSTYFYGISKEVAKQWVIYTKVKPKRVRVIYNAINTSYFQAQSDRLRIAQEMNINPEHRWILFVGRLTLRKGIDILFEGMKPLLTSGGISLLVVGFQNSKPEEAFGETNDFLKQLENNLYRDIPANVVHWLGKRDDIPRLMASADIMVHPARHEGFGLVVAEALAVGLPVVSTEVGGIPEVVEGTNTILTASEQPTELRKAVQKILNRTPAEVEYARNCAIKRAEFFRLERRTEEMLSYFQEIVSNQI